MHGAFQASFDLSHEINTNKHGHGQAQHGYTHGELKRHVFTPSHDSHKKDASNIANGKQIACGYNLTDGVKQFACKLKKGWCNGCWWACFG